MHLPSDQEFKFIFLFFHPDPFISLYYLSSAFIFLYLHIVPNMFPSQSCQLSLVRLRVTRSELLNSLIIVPTFDVYYDAVPRGAHLIRSALRFSHTFKALCITDSLKDGKHFDWGSIISNSPSTVRHWMKHRMFPYIFWGGAVTRALSDTGEAQDVLLHLPRRPRYLSSQYEYVPSSIVYASTY